MAKIFGQLEYAQLEILAADPTGTEGRIIYNSVSKVFKFHNGTSWLSNTEDISVGAVGATPNANGLTLTLQNLILQPASGSFPGALTAIAQTIGGNKTFQDNVILSALFQLSQAVDNTTTGAAALIGAPSKAHLILTNASLTSVSGIVAPSGASILMLSNSTGVTWQLENNTAVTPANGILTGTGANIEIEDGASVQLVYDLTNSRWRVIGGSGSGGSVTVGSDLTLTASDTIAINLLKVMQVFLVQGNSAAITLSGTPFGASAPKNGSYVELVGNHDDNTVTVVYNDAAKGVIGNLSADPGITLAKGQVAGFRYNATLDRWVLCLKS